MTTKNIASPTLFSLDTNLLILKKFKSNRKWERESENYTIN